MDRLAKLVAAALLAIGTSANAGYAQLSPPPGWSTGPAGNVFKPAANGPQWLTSTVRTNASLNVGGQIIKVPAHLRLAANAPRFAAKMAFGNPYLFVGALAAGAAYSYYQNGGFQLVDNVWHKKVIEPNCVNGTCNEYATNAYPTIFFPNKTAACNYYRGTRTGGSYIKGDPEISCDIFLTNPTTGIEYHQGSPSYVIKSFPESTIVKSVPATQQEFEDEMAPKPFPPGVIEELPWPMPVDVPLINPNPALEPQPLFVPTGDPVPNPNYNPDIAPGPDNQPWNQPGVRVTPRPTASEPWRVDLTPVNRPQTTPEPDPDPNPEPEVDDKPKPEEEQSLCEKHPDILACQKLDNPPEEDLPTSEKPISITPDSGWGADNASCPAPRHLTVQGRHIPIPYDLFCTWAQGLRPVILAMAWLSAAFILLGARNET